jgi:C4-dicarboxylate-specific signal transduction histidine kinase
VIDRVSLRWRVPAILALILIGAVVTLTALAYRAARSSVLEATGDRLSNAAQRIADIAAVGVTNLTRQASLVAEDPVILEALRTPGKPLTSAAHSALRRLQADTTLPLKVAVLDLEGRPVEGVAPELVREGPIERFAPIDSGVFHPFRITNGMSEYVIAVPVKDSGRVVGQLVQWRRLTRVTTALQLISDLIGDSAVLLIGNVDGTAKVELSDTLGPPLVRDSALARQARELHTSASAPIPGTPWAWSVEYPNDITLRPLRLLSTQTVLVAIGVVLLAILAGALLSRGMTTRLAQLTTAAESIAGGDLTLRAVPVDRRDEIGRLARSFTTMADSIRDSRDQLARRIEDRTADLNNTMTRLRDTQDELVRKERLATIGQLASSVGHELRNPLGVMSNSVYLLEHSVDSPNPKVQEYLRLLRSQIKLSERIVTDLLDSTRSRHPQRQIINLQPFLAAQMERVPVPPNVRVSLEVDEGLPPLDVDPDQVGQIIVNLLTNATQSIGDASGRLTVRARNGNGRVSIDVRDTGPGVPPRLTEKIFEPLYTTKARGIGLGLSVSRSLAAANSGSLTVLNHPEGGAVFTLELPAQVLA